MSNQRFVPVIGFVGGVGSGKSSIVGWVAARRKLRVLDGDAAGHQVLFDSDIKKQLRIRFGDSIFDEQGDVVRAALGSLVFGVTAEQSEARRSLESVVHPAIRELLSTQIAVSRNSNDVEAVLLDAAVLFEAGWDDLCEVVVFVESPFEQRLKRVIENRDWTEETLTSREASQMSLESKRNASTETIENSGTIAEAGARLEQLIDRIVQNHD